MKNDLHWLSIARDSLLYGILYIGLPVGVTWSLITAWTHFGWLSP